MSTENGPTGLELRQGSSRPSIQSETIQASSIELDDIQNHVTQLNDASQTDTILSPPQRNEEVENSKPYSSFTSVQKGLIVLVATLGGTFSPFTTNIYFPALTSIANDLSVSISDVNLTITTYMIFQGIAPSLVSAIADQHGRRPAYVLGFLVYMAANLGLALNNTYAGLLVLRCIQSCGSSGLVTLQQGTIADVVTSAERGKYISITSISSIVAPSIAPIAGGLLSGHLGWHSIFWFLLIMSATYAIPLILLFPETCRNVVADGSLPPPKWNKCLLNLTRKRSSESTNTEGALAPPSNPQLPRNRRKASWNPFATLKIIGELESAILLLVAGLIYASFYAISTSITVQFSRIYHLTETQQGLLFLPQALGSVFSAITNSFLLDRMFRKHAAAAGIEVDRKRQPDLGPMPIERARLVIAVPMFVVAALATVVYGWLLHLHISIAGPLVMLVLIGYCTLAGFNTLSVLLVDIHRKRAATASAANNLIRCLLGAAMSACINPMIDAMGNGWCFTLVGCIELSTVPLMLLLMRSGMRWRAELKCKAEERDQSALRGEMHRSEAHDTTQHETGRWTLRAIQGKLPRPWKKGHL